MDHSGCWPQVVDTAAAEVVSIRVQVVGIAGLEAGKLVVGLEVGKLAAGVGKFALVQLEATKEASEEVATQELVVDKQAFALVVIPYQEQDLAYYYQEVALHLSFPQLVSQAQKDFHEQFLRQT